MSHVPAVIKALLFAVMGWPSHLWSAAPHSAIFRLQSNRGTVRECHPTYSTNWRDTGPRSLLKEQRRDFGSCLWCNWMPPRAPPDFWGVVWSALVYCPYEYAYKVRIQTQHCAPMEHHDTSRKPWQPHCRHLSRAHRRGDCDDSDSFCSRKSIRQCHSHALLRQSEFWRTLVIW